jgi:hypothetical protein
MERQEKHIEKEEDTIKEWKGNEDKKRREK